MILYNGDCLIESKKIESNSIDLILTDLPYGTIKGLSHKTWTTDSTAWDVQIDLKELFLIADRVLKVNAKMLLFGNQPFTTELINNATTNIQYIYSYYWCKEHPGNCLNARQAPVSVVEDIVCFYKRYDSQLLNPAREYSKKILEYINKTYKEINKILNHRKLEHFFYYNSTQFELPSVNAYNILIEVFKINEMPGFLPYEELKKIFYLFNKESIFNLESRKTYKNNLLTYKRDYNYYHPTQKPIALLEDLISTYTNKGDVVLDFTMGSGSTGVAAKNLGRHFIGIEKDLNFFNIARGRIYDKTIFNV